MRLRESLKKKIYLKRHITAIDEEANRYKAFGEAIPIEAITWQGGGTVQAQQYGQDLSYIRNMHYDGKETITEGDGFCIFVGTDHEPDYEVIAVNNDYSPRVITLRYING